MVSQESVVDRSKDWQNIARRTNNSVRLFYLVAFLLYAFLLTAYLVYAYLVYAYLLYAYLLYAFLTF